jgi:hypothetical protein
MKSQKLLDLEKLKEESELKDCTFKPRIRDTSKTLENVDQKE